MQPEVFLVYVTIFEGIHEYTHFGLVKADSINSATQEAERLLEPYFSYDETTTVELVEVRHISDVTANTLLELNICDFMEDEDGDNS